MKKLITLTLAILLIMPFVISTTDEIRFIGEQNEELNIREPCFYNNTYCSATSQCNLTLINPNNFLLVNNSLMSNRGAYHNFTLNRSQTETLGVYEAIVICRTDLYNGFDTFYFKITPNGQEPSLVQGIVYVCLLIIFMILITLTTLGAYHLDGKNQYDFGGKLIKINVNKYFKIGLFFLTYLFLVVIFLFCEMITNNFLFLNFAEGVFHVLYLVLSVFLYPVMLTTIVLWILRIIGDVYVHKLNKRGLTQR